MKARLPSTWVRVRLTSAGTDVTGVAIGGTAVTVAEGTVRVP